MNRNEYYRRGLEYLFAISKFGVKAKVARCAGVDPSNLGAMLRGQRPFPEGKRIKLAGCMGLSEQDVERMGVDLTHGVKDSLHIQRVLAQKIAFPEIEQKPDLDIFTVNLETMEQYLVGEGWSVENDTIIAEFTKVPTFQARYIFKPKIKITLPAPPSDDEGCDEDT